MQRIDRLDYEDTEILFNRAFEECMYIDKLCARLGEDARGHINLIFYIIKLAARKGDKEYFESSAFDKHCKALGLNVNDAFEILKRKNLVQGRKLHSAEYYEHLRSKKEEMQSELDAGASMASIAKKYGVSDCFLNSLLKGNKRGKKHLYEPAPYQGKELDEMAKDRLAGASVKTIANKYHRNITIMSKQLRKHMGESYFLSRKQNKFYS